MEREEEKYISKRYILKKTDDQKMHRGLNVL